MLVQNILNLLYKQSPMDFYTYTNDKHTLIKSISNSSHAYEFEKEFSNDEINYTWGEIRLYKRFSTILIFLFFILLLYGIIFPHFTLFVNNTWYVNALIIFGLISVVCGIITFCSAKIFEKRIFKKFGTFKKTKFKQSNYVDPFYFKLFKFELSKALLFIIIICLVFTLSSPITKTQNYLKQEKYKDAIRVTSIGSVIFPIAPEWYSLRAYAKFKTGDFNGAIADFDKAYRLGADGFNAMHFDNKIYVKYIKKDYESAIKDFDIEIQHADSDYERDSFLWDKAQFLYNIGNYQKALELYNELIVKAENDRIFLLKDRLYLERAEVYRKLGMDELALKDIADSGSINPDIDYLNPIPAPVLIMDNL